MHRACLDQFLIAIRSFTLLCDHSRSKSRLIVIVNLVAKLGIIYATACHASLCRTAWVSDVTATAQCLLLLYKHGAARGGEMGISESAAAAAGALGLCKVLCWLPLIASRITPFLFSSPPSTGRPTDQPTVTVHPHWCHISSTVAYLDSLAYCATLGGAIDRDHWLRSAVDDVMIINHFVKWSRQAMNFNPTKILTFQASHAIDWKKTMVINREQDCPTRWSCIYPQGRSSRYESRWGQLSVESCLRPLSWCNSRCIKTWKNWVSASSDEDLVMRSKR